MSRLLGLIVTVSAIAACASAPYKQLRIDGSSEVAFNASVKSFRETLTKQREQFLVIALQDIWRTTALEADPASSEADTAKAYFARLDGLGYEEIIGLADATTPTVREQYYAMVAPPARPAFPIPVSQPMPAVSDPGLAHRDGSPVGMPQYSTSCGSVCR